MLHCLGDCAVVKHYFVAAECQLRVVSRGPYDGDAEWRVTEATVEDCDGDWCSDRGADGRPIPPPDVVADSLEE